AMQILWRCLRREYRGCVYPTHIGIELNGLTIRRNQFIRQRAHSQQKFVQCLATAAASLGVRRAVPKHGCQPSTRYPLPHSERQISQDRPSFLSSRKNVSAQ